MRVLMIGINHRTAAVELRERLSLSGDKLHETLHRLRAAHPAAEAVIVSTCNRTELYVARPLHEPPSFEDLTAFLAEASGVEFPRLSAATIRRENEEAIRQLFRVCSGLETMVLGEPQILGQVKRAYEFATERGAVGPVLHRVFQQAAAVGKQARTATGIDTGRLSVGGAAVDLARGVFERFDDKTVVAVGAGEMAKLALKHFMELRPGSLLLTNRTPQRAETLAARLELGHPGGQPGGVRPFEALDELLVEADVMLTGTGSQDPIITEARFRPLIRRRRSRPLFLIDIALPRDVEAAVGTLQNVYLYNLDDLQRVVDQTLGNRGEQVRECERIIQEAVDACLAAVRHRDVGHLIAQLRLRLHEIGHAEQERTARKLKSAADENDLKALIEEHTHRLVNKILHLPLTQLDQRQSDAQLGLYAAALRRLFDLKDGPPNPGDAAPPSPSTPAAPPSSAPTGDAASDPPVRDRDREA